MPLDATMEGAATPMALVVADRTARGAIFQPKLRYNARLRELNFGAPRFERPTVVVIDPTIFGTSTGSTVVAGFTHLKQNFTTALSNAVMWDDQSLRLTFSALSEDYDVAATEELSRSATKHFGW